MPSYDSEKGLVNSSGEWVNSDSTKTKARTDLEGSFSSAGTSKSGGSGWAQGLSWVPYDEFPSRLHRGERVLTAADNAIFNALGGLEGMQKALIGNTFATAASVPRIIVENNMQGAVYLDGYEVGKAVYQNWNDIAGIND